MNAIMGYQRKRQPESCGSAFEERNTPAKKDPVSSVLSSKIVLLFPESIVPLFPESFDRS
jgi:hypothetical protein